MPEIVVSAMREGNDKTTVQWSIGRSNRFYEAEVLFDGLQEQVIGKIRSAKGTVAAPGKEIQEMLLRVVRQHKTLASASHGQRHYEQCLDELDDALCELSQHIALERKESSWKINIELELWERTTPEHHTAANEFGSRENRPTPTVAEATKIGAQANYGQVGLNNHPRIRGMPERDKGEKSRGGTKTRQTFPTPTCRDHHAQGPDALSNPNRSKHLSTIIEKTMWPTPRAGNPGSRAPGTGGKVLGEEVKKWPTPTANAHQNPGEHGTGGPNLATAASGQLSPDWVEWLMGWPVGWTSPAPLSEDRFREWQTAHRIAWTASAPLATDNAPPLCNSHGRP
jgi:hypothetical protein